MRPQPAFVARFGSEQFEIGDALDRELLRYLIRRFQPLGIWASPPCEGYSTADFAGVASRVERLIAEVRDALIETGLPFVIENVQGAASAMSPSAVVLRGQDYGLQVERLTPPARRQ